MIRHGSACAAVTPLASWPMAQRMPFPELSPAQGAPPSKTINVFTLTPRKLTSIRPEPTLPDRQRVPARTIPQLIYP